MEMTSFLVSNVNGLDNYDFTKLSPVVSPEKQTSFFPVFTCDLRALIVHQNRLPFFAIVRKPGNFRFFYAPVNSVATHSHQFPHPAAPHVHHRCATPILW